MWLLVASCGSLLADDVGGHHAAARADVRQFRKRKARECRTDFAVEEQRIEIDELLRKFNSPLVGQSGKSLTCGRHAFLHEVVARSKCVIDRFVPTALVHVPADRYSMATVIIVRL